MQGPVLRQQAQGLLQGGYLLQQPAEVLPVQPRQREVGARAHGGHAHPSLEEPDFAELGAGVEGVQGQLLASLPALEHPGPTRSQDEEGIPGGICPGSTTGEGWPRPTPRHYNGPMQTQSLALLLFVAAALLLALALYGLIQRRLSGGAAFGLAMICCAAWSVAYALEILSVPLEAKTFWVKARIVPIALFPVLWFWLALQYTGRRRWLAGGRWVLFLIVPALTCLAVALPGDLGRLLRHGYRLDPAGAFPTLVFTNGPWFYVHLVHSFLLMGTSLLLLVASQGQAQPLFRRQSWLLIAGLVLPIVTEVVFQAGLSPLRGLNLSPFAFTVSGVLIGLSLFRYRLLDIMPVAGELVVQVMDDPALVLDPRGRLVGYNPAAERVIGASGPLVVGRFLAELPEPWASALKTLPESEAAGKEIRVRVGDRPRSYHSTLSPIPDEARRRRVGSLLLLHDQTEIRESQERLRLAFDSANDGLWDWHVPTGNAYFSPRYYAMLGYAPQEFQASYESWIRLVHPEDLDPARAEIRDCIEDGQDGYAVEFRMRTRDGQWRWVLSRGRVIERTGGGKVVRMVGTHVDITEYKLLEERLRASEEKFRSFIEQAAEAIVMTDEQGLIIEFNPAAERILGLPRREALGSPAWALMQRLAIRGIGMPPEALRQPIEERVREALASGRTGFLNRRFEATVPASASSPERRLQHYIFPIRTEKGFRLGSITHDVTEQRRAEAELRASEERLVRAQKMEAVGRLAGGIAHDFNNLLTVIKGYAELLEEGLPGDSPLRNDVEEISRAAQRAASLTAQLLAFGRRQILRPRVISLNTLVLDMQKMLRPVLGEDVELEVSLAPQPGNIRSDPGQVEQVLMNLALNARDATPAGGRITIATSRGEVGPRGVSEHPEIKPGRYVLLQVSDTGCGMEPHVLEQVFEPFFTTKEKGKGTGLGLSTAYGIVKQSGGYIFCASELDRGTRFHIYFPVDDGEIEAEPAPPASGLPGARPAATVLLVEDEEAVRGFARAVLASGGYRVLEAAAGAEALEIAQAAGEPIDLLLTDVVMPGMNGKDLAERLAGAYPGLRVLFMSGYTENAIAPRGVVEKGTTLIQKPFGAEELLARVLEELEGRPLA